MPRPTTRQEPRSGIDRADRTAERGVRDRRVVVVGFPVADLLDIACLTTTSDHANRIGARPVYRPLPDHPRPRSGDTVYSCTTDVTVLLEAGRAGLLELELGVPPRDRAGHAHGRRTSGSTVARRGEGGG